jgi:hypothetical protein
LYRVTQSFYARQYTSMWAPVVARQIFNNFQAFATCLSACDFYKFNCFNDTLFQINQISKFSAVHNVLNKPPCKQPHFHWNVTTFLDETFPGRWVGKGGPTACPPRSPDLTALDFFAWGFIKGVVCSRKVRDLAVFRQRVIEAFELITRHMLINTWQKLENRFDICRAITDAHIEAYLCA